MRLIAWDWYPKCIRRNLLINDFCFPPSERATWFTFTLPLSILSSHTAKWTPRELELHHVWPFRGLIQEWSYRAIFSVSYDRFCGASGISGLCGLLLENHHVSQHPFSHSLGFLQVFFTFVLRFFLNSYFAKCSAQRDSMVCETFLSVFLSSCARFSVRRQKSFSIRPIVFAKGVSGLETFAFAAFSAALELARLCSSRPIYDGSSKLIGQKVETAECGPGPLWSLINIFINFSTAFSRVLHLLFGIFSRTM